MQALSTHPPVSQSSAGAVDESTEGGLAQAGRSSAPCLRNGWKGEDSAGASEAKDPCLKASIFVFQTEQQILEKQQWFKEAERKKLIK